MSNRKREYDSIENAIADLRAGKIILCTDDPDRENEGDMCCGVCNAGEYQHDGQPCQGTDLHADELGICQEAEFPGNGVGEYR